jgi:hypothetical protein
MSGRPVDDTPGLVQIAIGVGYCRLLTAFIAVVILFIVRLIAGTS